MTTRKTTMDALAEKMDALAENARNLLYWRGRAEAAEASALTARRDGERDGLLQAAELCDAAASYAAAMKQQFFAPENVSEYVWREAASASLAKRIRTLASTVPGGEETPPTREMKKEDLG